MLFGLLVFYKYSATLFCTGPLPISMVALNVDLLGQGRAWCWAITQQIVDIQEKWWRRVHAEVNAEEEKA